jgi:tetraacyldisaccharide 4'-kinase
MIDARARGEVRARAARLAPEAVWAEVEHRPAALVDSAGAVYPLTELRDQPVVGFCGIGNPAGFRHTLEGLGCRIERWWEFPDHHDYTRENVDEIAGLIRESGARFAVCTRKDLVKLRVSAIGGAPLRAVSVELKFLCGEADLKGALQPIIDAAGNANEEMFGET